MLYHKEVAYFQGRNSVWYTGDKGSRGRAPSGAKQRGLGRSPPENCWDIFDALTAILGTEKQHNQHETTRP